MSTTINISCQDQRLTLITQPIVASGDINVDVVKFTFDSLWTDYTKTAVFYRDKDTVYHVVLNADNEASIPQEVLQDEGYVFIGVFGVSGDITRTSEVLRYKIKQGAITTGIPAPTPTPSIYAQILSELGNRVRFDEAQTLTDAQKLQARQNIGATNEAILLQEYTTDETTNISFSNINQYSRIIIVNSSSALTGITPTSGYWYTNVAGSTAAATRKTALYVSSGAYGHNTEKRAGVTVFDIYSNCIFATQDYSSSMTTTEYMMSRHVAGITDKPTNHTDLYYSSTIPVGVNIKIFGVKR